MILLNDLHVAVNRKGGTTPSSQEALRTYIFSRFADLLAENKGEHVVILGDLFDTFEVSARDWVQTYQILFDWLHDFKNGGRLCLVAGNHDWSDKGTRVSSFQMLCQVLEGQYARNFGYIPINGIRKIGQHEYVIAHCSNQDVFNGHLETLVEDMEAGDSLLLHANYDYKFAEQADHSLNVSEDQALAFTRKGINLLFAHEHQARTEIPHGTPAGGGAVYALGNQIPTSIADCLGNDRKFYHKLKNGSLEKIECWSRNEGYAEINWQDLPDTTTRARFIRVSGEASSAQASEVVNAIHRFRQKSDAFVIANAVKIDGIVAADELPAAFEAAKKFDVLEYIYRQLDAAEADVIRRMAAGLE